MINEQYASQMNFLQTYADAFEKRKVRLEEVKVEIEKLKPQVEEYEELQMEKEELIRTNRQDERFLFTMNEMVLRNSGQPISSGPLFDNKQKESEAA